MKPDALNFLNTTIQEHKSFIHRLGVNDLLKKELIKDVSKIEITLNNAIKKGEPNETKSDT
jgi:hypothetical protein